MSFIPKTIDEANIQAQYLEGDKQKQQTNPHKQVEPQEQQRKNKNKKKWNENKVVVATQEETPSIQQCKGCDRKGHMKENCWKLHPEKRPKKFSKKKKKALISMDVEERVDSTSDPEGKINCTNI
jgi:hypothetical protein